MTPSPDQNRQTSIPLWVSLTALTLLVAVGGAMIWANKADTPADDAGGDQKFDPRIARLPVNSDLKSFAVDIVKPLPPVVLPGNLHSFCFTEENGTKVVKIRVVPDGDEVVIDAKTGRLIETRVTKPMEPMKG